MVVALNERGAFTWSEWAETFAPLNDGANYWAAWLEALERISVASTGGEARELHDLVRQWREAADATPHGEPIRLRR